MDYERNEKTKSKGRFERVLDLFYHELIEGNNQPNNHYYFSHGKDSVFLLKKNSIETELLFEFYKKGEEIHKEEYSSNGINPHAFRIFCVQYGIKMNLK